jgi:hypothetical protein
VFASLILAVLVTGADARADITITFELKGLNVVETGTGAIDLSGLTINTNGGILQIPPLNPSDGIAIVGQTRSMNDLYTGFTGPSSFGSGGFSSPSSATGDVFGIGAIDNDLAVPQGYISGSTVSATDTFDNSNFTTLGLTAGTYTYTWGTGPNQTLTVQIGPAAAVPEPSTAIVAVLGAVAFITYGWIRRRRQQRRQVSA